MQVFSVFMLAQQEYFPERFTDPRLMYVWSSMVYYSVEMLFEHSAESLLKSSTIEISSQIVHSWHIRLTQQLMHPWLVAFSDLDGHNKDWLGYSAHHTISKCQSPQRQLIFYLAQSISSHHHLHVMVSHTLLAAVLLIFAHVCPYPIILVHGIKLWRPKELDGYTY